MSEAEFANTYIQTDSVHIHRPTDINEQCLAKIMDSVFGKKVLDVACGRGFLSNMLSSGRVVVGVDIVVPPSVSAAYPAVEFHEASVECLPFSDNEFDTVISTHTIEHVLCPETAVRELKRVTKHVLIVVVPKQRPYKYTFDLHLNFFPEKYDLIKLMRPGDHSFQCFDCGGDWFYVEEVA